MVRVRYKYNILSLRFESPPIFTGRGFVLATYNGLNYSIVLEDNTEVSSGVAKNANDLKKQLKQELLNIGANFTDEVRTRKEKQ